MQDPILVEESIIGKEFKSIFLIFSKLAKLIFFEAKSFI